MEIWKNVQKHWPDWLSINTKPTTASEPAVNNEQDPNAKKSSQGDSHLNLATQSLRRLLEDKNLPEDVRNTLKDDYTQVQSMLDKLEHGHIHIAVFGRVSVGKSSLLNALLGKDAFSVSVLHGETKTTDFHAWEEYSEGGLYLIDTPGINEIAGEDRERMAHEVATRADLVLFVIDGDLTDVEFRALKTVAASHRPTILVVNKADRYTDKEKQQLKTVLEERAQGVLEAENIIFTTAQASRQTVIYIDAAGNEQESVRVRPVDVLALKLRLWDIIESEGKTLAALNASLFASNLSEEVGKRILVVKHELGLKTIHTYCIAQGVAVALNPIPIADLIAAAAIDAGMIVHLSRLYGLPMSKSEAGDLLKTISGQMIVLIGTTWAVHLVATVLKLGTGGLSVLLTGATQGAVAWYSTLVVGRVAEKWLANGKSWGEMGPKFTVEQILDSLDRDSVITEAREEIMAYLRKTVKS